MDFNTASNGYVATTSSGTGAPLALDTTAKDKLVVLVSPTSTCGNMQVVSNLDSFNSSEEGVEIPGKLYLQISNCDNVHKGLNMLLKVLQGHSDLLKNTAYLDISFVKMDNSKGDITCIDDAKSVAEELVKLLPHVTFYACDLGMIQSDTMFAITSAVVDMYASQLTGLVCNWKALRMDKMLELSSLEYLSIRKSGGSSRLFEDYIWLPKLNHLSIDVCPFTLSFLCNLRSPQIIPKLTISIEDTLLLEMTDYVLYTASKEMLEKHYRNTTGVFDPVLLSNDLLSKDVLMKEAAVFINKEIDPDDVARVSWDNATKLVANTYIGFADILMILHHSRRINALEAEKVIERLDYETFYIFELLDETPAIGDGAIYDIACPAWQFDGCLPAKLCDILDCSKIDEVTVSALRRWGYWYNSYLKEMDATTIYHIYPDNTLPKEKQYGFEERTKAFIHSSSMINGIIRVNGQADLSGFDEFNLDSE